MDASLKPIADDNVTAWRIKNRAGFKKKCIITFASILGTDKALGMEFSKIIAYPKRSLYFINLNRLVQQAILLQLLP